MRIAIVHSFYRSSVPSGENAVVLDQVDALRERGHVVHLVRRDTDDEVSDRLYPLKAASRVLTGLGPSPLEELESFRPDVVHVHNLFPGFGTNWLDRWHGRLVATLHNFRSICANGLLFRGGAQCFECPDGSYSAAVRHACYHDSRVATLPLAVRNARGIDRNALLRRADTVICLSEAAAAVFLGYGLGPGKTVVIPNGIPVPPMKVASVRSSRWLAAGRFTPEKGFLELVREWPTTYGLDLIGQGDEEESIKAIAGSSIRVLPLLPRAELLDKLAGYQGLVFPSQCLDSQPTIVSEALSAGLPIVAHERNSVASLVNQTGSGTVYSDSTELHAALAAVGAARPAMAAAARGTFLRRFTRSAWVSSLEDVYSSPGERR
jgi:glycosyltransferase involved in cell wall biosynthesis